jgi:hypothetical protein
MAPDFTQWGAALLGLPALVLVQSQHRGRVLLGNLLGLASQPFWIWGTWQNGQWGWLVLSLAYVAVWGRGVWKSRDATTWLFMFNTIV